MENVNQDAMMHPQQSSFKPDTGGPLQIPDQGAMLNDDDSTDVNSPLIESDEASGNMVPDDGLPGDEVSMGNNDGTEPDPEETDTDE